MTTDDVAADLAPTGTLRAVVNLGNPVLAQGTVENPSGVTVDLARAIGGRLGVPVALECVQAARSSFDALVDGRADVAFLAIEPARADQVRFTAPYVVIEGVYVVPDASSISTADDVDRPGVRVGVKLGSAYDLFLTRTLADAELVRGDEGVDVFVEQGLEVGAGIRQPVERFVAENPGHRVIEPRFTQIQQAVAAGRDSRPDTVAFLAGLVEELKADGSVVRWLEASGQGDAQVAPPA